MVDTLEEQLWLCPRCDKESHDFGGTSRVDNSTRICNQCEQDESLEDYFFGFVSPKENWPVFFKKED